MKIKAYRSFKKAYQKLPENIKRKTDRQLQQLQGDVKHPSLHTKKIKGRKGIWEARVDIHYRISFEIDAEIIFLRAIGNHDEVLKKP